MERVLPQRRILVADDDPVIRSLYRQILEGAGYEVELRDCAGDIEAAIVRFQPDAVLLDILMPGADGLSVCRRLRAAERTSGLPIVVVSAKTFDADQRAALAAGATGFVRKPFLPRQLLDAIERSLTTRSEIVVWGSRGSTATPEHGVGRYGGNTSCVELVVPGRARFILDAGTGIRALGNSMAAGVPYRLGIFLTHFHWDHILGLPFFRPLYESGAEIEICGPASRPDDLVKTLAEQIGGAFFPISLDAFMASTRYIGLQEQVFELHGVTISTFYAFHPGQTLAYRFHLEDGDLVYVPDNELLPESVGQSLSGEALRLSRFIDGAALLIHDCQYREVEYEKRRGWGHSSTKSLARLVAQSSVDRVLLFHHDPDHDDSCIDEVGEEFQREIDARGVDVWSEPAREGATYTIR